MIVTAKIRKIGGKPTTVIIADSDTDASSDYFKSDGNHDYDEHNNFYDSSDEEEVAIWNLENE